ncbi:MAG: phosphatidylglycerophosphatase A family protein [Phycisphaerae bacterium]
MKAINKLIITSGGTGYLPVAPGTWASAALCGVYLLVGWCVPDRSWVTSAVMAAVAVLATLGCILLGPQTETAFGRKDPSHCTLDEWAGQALTLVMLPTGGAHGRLIAAGAGFVAFRAFDIVKPPPARQLEKLPHGWGVAADDLIAGLYANILAQLFLRLVMKF